MTSPSIDSLPPQPPFDDELVEAFLKVPEGPSFDCKRLGKLDRVIEAVVAFANADGGTIALGLEDPPKRTTVTACTASKKIHWLWMNSVASFARE